MRRFIDCCGNIGYIRIFKNGSARLLIYSRLKIVKRKDYKSEKGARIALGMFSDSFLEIE